MPQTTVQDAKQIRFNSAKVEGGDNIGAMVNLGAASKVKFQETFEPVSVIGDNVGEIEVRGRNHKCRLTYDMIEFNLFNLEMLRGDVDTYATQAAAPVTGHVYVVASGAWLYDNFIEYDYQNGSGAKITPTTVVGSIDGALVLNTDYFIVKNAAGKWGIVVHDSATVTTEAQTITITFNYTPAANRSLSTGGGEFVINPKVLRLTNTDVDGKNLTILVYKARNTEGITLEFPVDDNGEPMPCSQSLEGVRDTSRSVKDQLFKITDEQGA